MGGLGYEYDDGGRSESGHVGVAEDCVVRALAILSGEDYGVVHADFSRFVFPDMGVDKLINDALYSAYGLVKVKVEWGIPKPTYGEMHDAVGNCIVVVRNHVAAVVDGCLRDIFDHRLNGRGMASKTWGGWCYHGS